MTKRSLTFVVITSSHIKIIGLAEGSFNKFHMEMTTHVRSSMHIINKLKVELISFKSSRTAEAEGEVRYL